MNPFMATVVVGGTSGTITVMVSGTDSLIVNALKGPTYTAGQRVVIIQPYGAILPVVLGVIQ